MFTGSSTKSEAADSLRFAVKSAYVPNGKKVGYIGSTGGDDLKALIKNNDWNDLHIIARGNTLIHLINGRVMSVVVDDDTANRKMDGKIGIQLHVTQRQ